MPRDRCLTLCEGQNGFAARDLFVLIGLLQEAGFEPRVVAVDARARKCAAWLS